MLNQFDWIFLSGYLMLCVFFNFGVKTVALLEKLCGKKHALNPRPSAYPLILINIYGSACPLVLPSHAHWK